MTSDERDMCMSGPDLVCVFRTGDEALAAIVKSILDGEGIRYVASSADLQELFGAGSAGGSFDFAAGPVDFLVSQDDAERARRVLEALRQGFLSGGPAEEGDSKAR